jgi:hypothetical protein
MNKITTTFLATVKSFTNGEADKNGNLPVILNPVAGKCPDKRVIAGTVALNDGMQINKTYLISCTEGDEDPEYGRQFNYSVVAEASLMEIVQSTQFLGAPSLIVTETVNQEQEEEQEILE